MKKRYMIPRASTMPAPPITGPDWVCSSAMIRGIPNTIPMASQNGYRTWRLSCCLRLRNHAFDAGRKIRTRAAPWTAIKIRFIAPTANFAPTFRRETNATSLPTNSTTSTIRATPTPNHMPRRRNGVIKRDSNPLEIICEESAESSPAAIAA
jgi:hypothetical protein